MEGAPIAEPRLIRYRAGRRRKVWVKNCVAFGLAAGFVEPLESTSIHLFMIGATRLAQFFPFGGIGDALVERYNALSQDELERVRDFIILHYKLNERDDSPFWRRCRDMDVPDTLAERIALFREQAIAWQGSEDLFRVNSWVQVMLGQRLEPKSWHRLGRLMPPAQLRQALGDLQANVARTVAQLPPHQDFLDGYCPAAATRAPKPSVQANRPA